ncbi:hypothetical protein [Amycolatopsis sp. A1MSW2902]|uniref:hypothetical protein n=1 Tax=Amycolatopsis sp. A1MSW2902 TaxID=687413 RepID=UPI00307E92A4
MAKRDMIDDLVDIRHPLPRADEMPEGDEDIYSDWCSEVTRDRDAYERELRMHEEHEEGDWDPLLAEIHAAHQEMRAAEKRMRTLVAYGREFIKPHPYQLKQLAEATGMSISGTRSSYTVAEVAEVARRIGRQPRFRTDETGE